MSNLIAKDLFGSMTALVTPMYADGEIDYSAWKNLLYLQIKAGIKAIVVAGTTGESAVLEEEDFRALLMIAVDMCTDQSTKVIAQTGSISAQEVIHRNQIAAEIGAHAVLIVTPYYLRTTQDGLLQHFSLIAKHSELPIILYNVPSRTHNDLLPITTKKLANNATIIGIKEASNDENRIKELVKILPSQFAILSGNDDTFLESMTQGAIGVISVASNVRPQTIYEICNFMALGDTISAKKLNSSLEPLYKMLSYQPNPIPVKYLLHKAGYIDTGIRLPLVWLSGTIVGSATEITKIKTEYSNI
ncbi:MAG: 4-hydroxy-tetrahydrodipicolinate synthase [Proteobacteria bacterium]|nr:4-hydroxy-tetrahydrodipicolinate synthase [Pseudomonadota bacterium]